jgi:uncharacterized protein (UPF0332 family)
MNQEIEAFLTKAEESLDAAKGLFEDALYGFSSSRAYYAMFYAVEALLLSRGLSYPKHSAVLSAFGREFIKKGPIEPKWHQMFHEAFEVRQVGDYEPIERVSEVTSRRVLENAKAFVQMIRSFLK